MSRFVRNATHQIYKGISETTGLAVFGPLTICGADEYFIEESGTNHPVNKKTVEPLEEKEE